MALPSAIKLFINPRTGLAFGNFNGSSQITNPAVTLGDTARFEIYLVEDTGISSYPRQEVAFPGTPGIKIAVGPIDEPPLAGTWKASFGGDTTSALAYNITAAALATALNSLASITAAGGVTVSKIGGNYNIVFNLNGARGDILTDGAALIPLSSATVSKLQIGDSTRPQIVLVHLQRTIAGLATSFAATPASAISIASLSAWDGSRATYRASIMPDPKGGSFSLAFDAATGTDVSSASIAIGASATDVQNALNLGALVDKVSVSQVGAYAYDITVTAQPGTGGLTANGAGLISFSGYVGELSLNTAEAISLLDGAEEIATNLEVEITSDSKTLTVLQIPCTLKNAVIDAGSVQPLILDTYLTEASADGRYARQANNLSDLASVSQARTNLGVYSTSSVDTALALKASLSGATFSGEIAAPTLGNILNTDLVIDSYNDTGAGTHYYHKFTPFNGKFVLAPNGGGLTFPDGTTQVTAATTPNLSTYAPLANPNFTGVSNFNNTSGFAITIGDPSEPLYYNKQTRGTITITNGSSSIFTRMDNEGFKKDSQSGASLYRGQLTETYVSIQNPTDSIALTIDGVIKNSVELYARNSGATFTGRVNLAARASGAAASINLGAVPDNAAAPSTLIEGDIFLTDIEPLAGNFNTRLNYVGKTFSGSLAAIQLATLNGVSNYFSQTQNVVVTSTSPAYKITQLGTGAALLVEDSTTPDTSALVVDAAGNVGIGVAVGYTATDKVEVVGNLKATAFKNGSGAAFAVGSVTTHSSGSDTDDLLISIGGSTYRIGLRFVSTP